MQASPVHHGPPAGHISPRFDSARDKAVDIDGTFFPKCKSAQSVRLGQPFDKVISFSLPGGADVFLPGTSLRVELSPINSEAGKFPRLLSAIAVFPLSDAPSHRI
jgi:hypothetical protein